MSNIADSSSSVRNSEMNMRHLYFVDKPWWGRRGEWHLCHSRGQFSATGRFRVEGDELHTQHRLFGLGESRGSTHSNSSIITVTESGAVLKVAYLLVLFLRPCMTIWWTSWLTVGSTTPSPMNSWSWARPSSIKSTSNSWKTSKALSNVINFSAHSGRVRGVRVE